MLDRVASGELATKPHTALRRATGELYYEECFTREGFDGPYTILYHERRPHALSPTKLGHVAIARRGVDSARDPDEPHALLRRHFRTAAVPPTEALIDSRVPLLFSDDLTVYTVKPTASDPAYFVNGDGDELFFVRAGSGIVRSAFGDLRVSSGDYVCVPKGVIYRFLTDGPKVEALLIECKNFGIPTPFRNATGQLRMDAPYSHRDFKRPEFHGPMDEHLRDIVIKRHGVHHGFRAADPPLDVVGWDGTVYPWALPILAFQPRVSAVHLPPTAHLTFTARGLLVSSFVPRPLDFHPNAVPCPYPHTSVDIDEVIYYASGAFASHTGVGEGSLTLHPAGLPHGPHPGRYEASIGVGHTEEVAVMLDCERALTPTAQARNVEDADYDASFLE